MKKILYIVLALILVVFAVIKLKSNKETTQKRVYQYQKETPVGVQANTLKPEMVYTENLYPGTFEPNRETRISAEVQGKINSVRVDVGSHVNAGQALVQLDNSLLQLQLKASEVQIEGLETDINRYKVLVLADAIQGVQLEKTELGLKSAMVQKATILEQINKTTIVAPFGGIVTAKMTESGAFAAPGIPLLQITDISKLKFTINIPEKDLSQFASGAEYQLVADAIPGIVFSGKVSMIGSKANPGNNYVVQLMVGNTPDLKIKAGMSGSVKIRNAESEKQIIIPASAIVGTNIKPRVYVVKNGKAALQDIIVARRFENKIVVLEGLTAGDVVVTSGFINLFEGANVTIK